MNQRAQHDQAVKALADKGKLVEAGFLSLRLSMIPKDATAVQIQEMRLAFLAGAQHVWASMMTMLDPGREPTAQDLRRMTLLAKELDALAKELAVRVAPTGRAH
jgi:hypothetical protein